MTGIYLNDWKGCDAEYVLSAFDVDRWNRYRETALVAMLERPDFIGIEILLASYECPGYEGGAFVLFRKDGKLYEVNGSHCSCYGLEGQWEPEEVTVEELKHRLTQGRLGSGRYCNPFAVELAQLLETL